jgi:hypothetical protein
MKKKKPYWEMTTKELGDATKEFDQEFIADSFHPLSPEERARWDRLRTKVGRPRRGQGVKVISLSIERGLLDRTDTLARRMGLSRAALIEKSLRATLITEGKD